MMYSLCGDRTIISPFHRAGVTVLTWGHPWIWWRLLSSVALLPVKVIVSALAVPARCQRLLKVTIACDKRKKFIWLYIFSINLLLKWMNKLNSPPFFSPAVFIMQYARQWDAFKWDRVKDYCSRRGTTYITIISNTAVQFHNDKNEVSKLHHRYALCSQTAQPSGINWFIFLCAPRTLLFMRPYSTEPL